MLIEDINKREMGFLECLVVGKDVYVKNFQDILKIVLLIAIPINIAIIIVNGMAAPLLTSISWKDILEGGQAFKDFVSSGRYRNLALYYVVISLLQSTLYPLVIMSVARMTKNFVCGLDVKVGEAVAEAFQKGWILIIASILYQVIVLSGTVLFIIPGILLQVLFLFYVYAIILDDKGIVGCLKYSRKLVKGYFGKTFFTALTVLILSYCITELINFPFLFIPSNIAIELIALFVISVLDCFILVGITIYYLNRQSLKGEETKPDPFSSFR